MCIYQFHAPQNCKALTDNDIHINLVSEPWSIDGSVRVHRSDHRKMRGASNVSAGYVDDKNGNLSLPSVLAQTLGEEDACDSSSCNIASLSGTNITLEEFLEHSVAIGRLVLARGLRAWRGNGV